MVELHRQGFDQVIARRDREGDKVVRSFLSRTYYWLINKMVDVKLVDGVGDFRLLSRRAVDALLSMPEYNRFSKGLYSWIGFDAVTFEYKNAVREAGETKWSFRRLLNYGLDGLMSFNNRPLRAAIYLGFVSFAIAFFYMLWIIIAYYLNVGPQQPGYVTLITAIVGMGGLQMFTVGVIGEYIGRIYYESKQRPHYLVKETEGGPLQSQADFVSGTSAAGPPPVHAAPGHAPTTGPSSSTTTPPVTPTSTREQNGQQ
jgi:glycosyltransferase involved in cell wall biosynthesis